MTETLNLIIKYIESGEIYFVLLTVLISLLFNFRKITHFLEERKRTKIERISEALKCSQLDGKTKQFLEEQIVNEHFKLATGLGIEKEFREKIIETHEKTNGELSFTHFKRALQYMIYEDKTLEIRISGFEKMLQLFNWSASFAMTAAGFFMFFLFCFSGKSSLYVKYQLFMLGIVCVLIAVFMIFQTFPVRSAKFVRDELLKQQNNT